MRCQKCGFHSFDYLSACKKCGSDLSSIRDSLGLLGVKPQVPFFLNVLLRSPGEMPKVPTMAAPSPVFDDAISRRSFVPEPKPEENPDLVLEGLDRAAVEPLIELSEADLKQLLGEQKKMEELELEFEPDYDARRSSFREPAPTVPVAPQDQLDPGMTGLEDLKLELESDLVEAVPSTAAPSSPTGREPSPERMEPPLEIDLSLDLDQAEDLEITPEEMDRILHGTKQHLDGMPGIDLKLNLEDKIETKLDLEPELDLEPDLELELQPEEKEIPPALETTILSEPGLPFVRPEIPLEIEEPSESSRFSSAEFEPAIDEEKLGETMEIGPGVTGAGTSDPGGRVEDKTDRTEPLEISNTDLVLELTDEDLEDLLEELEKTSPTGEKKPPAGA